jgi:hypothetical protein
MPNANKFKKWLRPYQIRNMAFFIINEEHIPSATAHDDGASIIPRINQLSIINQLKTFVQPDVFE